MGGSRRPVGDTARWAATTTVVAAAVTAAMVLIGMDPRLVIVVCVIALVSATAWLVTGLSAVADPLVWYDDGATAWSSARTDRRVMQLTSRLRRSPRRSRRWGPVGRSGADEPEPDDEIVTTLAAVIDDQLRSRHGIVRAEDGDAAARVLGPELSGFVDDPATARRMTQRRTLARTVAMIEAFTSPAPPMTDHPKDDR